MAFWGLKTRDKARPKTPEEKPDAAPDQTPDKTCLAHFRGGSAVAGPLARELLDGLWRRPRPHDFRCYFAAA